MKCTQVVDMNLGLKAFHLETKEEKDRGEVCGRLYYEWSGVLHNIHVKFIL